MQSYYQKKSGKRTKIIIGIGIVLVIILIVVVGWLIVRVTHDQPQTVVYKDEKADGNGLSTSADSGNGLSLQGLPLPGQENTQSGGSSSTGSSSSSPSGSSGGSSSGNSGSSANTQQPVRSQTLPNGLKIEEYNAGSGSRATKVGDTLAVHYVGYLPDGKVFDTSLKGQKQPFAFKLGAGKVIAGWDIGLQDMKVGAIRRLTIPAALAYGAHGSPPTIPPNTPLIFDTQLMGIQ